MKKEFNLEKALNGAKLVTRDGREVSNFRNRPIRDDKCRSKNCTPYKYLADVDSESYSFTNKGKYRYYNVDNDLDLFIDEFTISDLKTGMRVKLKTGYIYIVFKLDNKIIFTNGKITNNIDKYNEDFTNKIHKELDIIKVYNIPNNLVSLLDVNILGELLWEGNENIDVLDSEDFYNIMQNYRITANGNDVDKVIERFKAVKDWIRNNYK